MQLKDGFSLIEVMIAFVIILVALSAIVKVYMVYLHADSYADNLSYATTLADAKLHTLETFYLDAPDLKASWYKDPGNPLRLNNRGFYRFWSVKDIKDAKEITVYVTWDDYKRGRASNFSSLSDLGGSKCAKLSLKGYVLGSVNSE